MVEKKDTSKQAEIVQNMAKDLTALVGQLGQLVDALKDVKSALVVGAHIASTPPTSEHRSPVLEAMQRGDSRNATPPPPRSSMSPGDLKPQSTPTIPSASASEPPTSSKRIRRSGLELDLISNRVQDVVLRAGESGITLAEMAKVLKLDPTAITHPIAMLIKGGLVVKVGNKRWTKYVSKRARRTG